MDSVSQDDMEFRIARAYEVGLKDGAKSVPRHLTRIKHLEHRIGELTSRGSQYLTVHKFTHSDADPDLHPFCTLHHLD